VRTKRIAGRKDECADDHGARSLLITPEEAYNLLYHNDDFLRSIWESQGFRGE
jgi:hypothetical protein